MAFTDIELSGIDTVLQQSKTAFEAYRHKSGKEKALFLRAIATEIEDLGQILIETAMAETNLPEGRLLGERGRTTGQLRLFADLLDEGSWVEARIDTANPNRQALAKPDLRKMSVGIGPVVVFGSSNFPFAYSTAGGDTASALAAGCSVIVKAHPAHPKTSEMVASAIQKAIEKCAMPSNLFQHVHGKSFAVGQALVAHPGTKAVGFTGSLVGGRALFDTANQRAVPIPVFAEMGSINPAVLLPEKLANEAELIAKQYAASITLGVGQFCTNPGLILAIESAGLAQFMDKLASEIEQIVPATMLHAGIYQNYEAKRTIATEQAEVKTLAESTQANTGLLQGRATVASVSAKAFIQNPILHQEVFGPYSLVVICEDFAELSSIIDELEGQLTATVMATEAEVLTNLNIIQQLQNCCGRLILNGVPTGVEVAFSMQHGGPYPASTDGRFGAVGPDAIKRFVRPMSYQGFPDNLLPDELKAKNPLNILRIVDGEWVR